MSPGLRENIEEAAQALGAFIGECPRISQDRRAAFGERMEEIRRGIASADRPLRIALLGGTGVGKSTVVNALAGSEISPRSRRRPTTTGIVVFAHRSWPGEPDLPLGDDGRVSRHDEDSIRDLLIIDLPDFDSLRPEGRRIVDRLLPKMDQIIWVVDKEKYNDRRLHEDYVKKEAPYRQNFIFLFNKVDEFLGAEGVEGGMQQLSVCVTDLIRSLERDGVAEPAVFPVSALDALERKLGQGQGDAPAGEPVGEFADFERHVRTKYTEKYREQIRQENVVQGLTTLAGEIAAELRPDEGERRVQEVRRRLEAVDAELSKAAEQLVVGEILSRERRRLLAGTFRKGYLEDLPGVIGWLAESWLFQLPALPWFGAASRGGEEALKEVFDGKEAGPGCRRLFDRLVNTSRDLEAPLEGVALERSSPGRMRLSEETWRAKLRSAIGRVAEEAREGIEEPVFLGRGQVMQHFLPWIVAGGVGLLSWNLWDYLRQTEVLHWFLLMIPFSLVLIYLAEASLAHRAVRRAAQQKTIELREMLSAGVRRVVQEEFGAPAGQMLSVAESWLTRWREVEERVGRLRG